jgi:hypothetical protein
MRSLPLAFPEAPIGLSSESEQFEAGNWNISSYGNDVPLSTVQPEFSGGGRVIFSSVGQNQPN